MSAQPSQSPTEHVRDELEQVLSYHGGDALAAIRTLLEDCRHLRRELALAEGAMSLGMTRGWRPNYERTDHGQP